jgi:hypothetical protein
MPKPNNKGKVPLRNLEKVFPKDKITDNTKQPNGGNDNGQSKARQWSKI